MPVKSKKSYDTGPYTKDTPQASGEGMDPASKEDNDDMMMEESDSSGNETPG